MSEPQSPPPPPEQPPAEKKKGLGPVAWILIGCGGLLLVAFLLMGACGMFVAKKAKEFAENPARSAAELIVRANPHLEITSADDEAGTITILDTNTGEEVTLDWSDIQEGNFSFSTDEGEFNVDASGGDDGAIITMTDSEGEATTQIFGTGGEVDAPDWIPMAADARDVQSTYSTRSGNQASGAFHYSTSSSIDDVMAFYDEELSQLGFEVSRNTHSSGGRQSGSVTGSRDGNSDTILVAIADEGGDTQVVVNYTDGG